jgi:hypothetical protein
LVVGLLEEDFKGVEGIPMCFAVPYDDDDDASDEVLGIDVEDVRGRDLVDGFTDCF